MLPGPVAFIVVSSLTLTQSQLRWELLNVSAGVLLTVIGLGATSLYFFRAKTRDLTLVYFGLFAALYGIRLLSQRPSIEATLDLPARFWAFTDWGISAVIILPFGLFVYQLVGDALKRFFRWLVWAQAIAAFLEIVAGVFGVRLAVLASMNNIVVLCTFAISAIFVALVWFKVGRGFTLTHDVRVFLVGFGVWAAFILELNLASLGVIRGIGHNIEFVGFLTFVCCLGYITARRSFATEERLLALHAELGVARQIQSATLPREIPNIRGLSIAARYVPMSEVAGDFYDFLVDGDERLGILIADVSGHGVPAALIASMVKVAFAAQSQYIADPVRVLTGLNLALSGKFEDHYVTAAYVFVDTANFTMRYAGAAHPPLMLASRSIEHVRMIEENGTMLGLFPEAPYTAAQIRLQPGDRVLLYTDGVFEAMSPGLEEYSKPRIEKFMTAHNNLSASNFADALLADVNRWSDDPDGRSQDDDITVVVLDIQPSPKASA